MPTKPTVQKPKEPAAEPPKDSGAAAEDAQAQATPQNNTPIEPIRDKEMESLMPRPTPEQHKKLEKQILKDGKCRDALVVWKGTNILLDGYTRHSICVKYKLGYTVIALEFEDRDAAIRWVMDNQDARRNYTDQGRSYVRGKKHLAGASAEELATEYGVTAKTIKRDADWAKAIDKVCDDCGDEFREGILSGRVKLSVAEVKELASMRRKDLEKIVPQILADGKWLKPKRETQTSPEQRILSAWAKVKEKEHRLAAVNDLLRDKEFRSLLAELNYQTDEPPEQEGDDGEEDDTDEQGEDE
jgi:hypothetical protein